MACTTNPIGLLPILLIFMSRYLKNIRVAIAKFATKFLKSFMLELEHIFCYGFEVENYNYSA
jgi:hypothetical protein